MVASLLVGRVGADRRGELPGRLVPAAPGRVETAEREPRLRVVGDPRHGPAKLCYCDRLRLLGDRPPTQNRRELIARVRLLRIPTQRLAEGLLGPVPCL